MKKILLRNHTTYLLMTAKTLYTELTFVNSLSEYQPVHVNNEPYKYSHIIAIRTIYIDYLATLRFNA